MVEVKAIELFSGCGGASEGMMRAGLTLLAAVDYDRAACLAHRRWHPEVPVIRARAEDAHVILANCKPAIVWASPSCCPWSAANRTPKRGKAHPEYYSLARLVRQFAEMRARWLVVENVGGLLWSREGKVELAEMRAEARRLGLRWMASVVNSNSCGVAQIRRRVFVVVGPEYVRIPHGNDYIPPEGCASDQMDLFDEVALRRATRGQAIMACEGSKGLWERETRWPKASSDAVRAGTLAHRSEARDRPTYAEAVKGVVGSEHGLARSRMTRERWGARQAAASSAVGQAAWSSAPLRDGAHGREWAMAKRAVGRDDRHPHRPHLSKRGDAFRDGGTGRDLATCCALQQVPLAVVAGLPKRVAHELVGNCVPPPLTAHVARVLLRADGEAV